MKMFTLLPLIAIFWTSGVAALLSTCPQKSAQTNFNTSDVRSTLVCFVLPLGFKQSQIHELVDTCQLVEFCFGGRMVQGTTLEIDGTDDDGEIEVRSQLDSIKGKQVERTSIIANTNEIGNNYVIKTYTFDKEDPSSTEAKFRSVDADGSRFTIGSLLYVLSTDYTNYAVIWGCSKRSTGEMEAAEYAGI
ncbi:unnamed protein product [Timema podura]|uniref:Uncharacterized protein n=1 Tax=Timema podura TaxID=61482 RepID=A0ABN7P2E9_TIMPD|nr:unnamed protein product [Timema podura]